jgi:hypothetical protein
VRLYLEGLEILFELGRVELLDGAQVVLGTSDVNHRRRGRHQAPTLIISGGSDSEGKKTLDKYSMYGWPRPSTMFFCTTAISPTS